MFECVQVSMATVFFPRKLWCISYRRGSGDMGRTDMRSASPIFPVSTGHSIAVRNWENCSRLHLSQRLVWETGSTKHGKLHDIPAITRVIWFYRAGAGDVQLYFLIRKCHSNDSMTNRKYSWNSSGWLHVRPSWRGTETFVCELWVLNNFDYFWNGPVM